LEFLVPKEEELIKRYRLLFIFILIIGGTGCSAFRNKEIISSMLSDDEDRYYITILGAPQQVQEEFEVDVYQPNLNKVSGYYSNGNPSEEEMKVLNIGREPTFIVFDTKSEVFRTNNLQHLNQFLLDKNTSAEIIKYDNARKAAWEYLKEKGWNDSAKEEWESAIVKQTIADEKYELVDKRYIGHIVLSVAFDDQDNVVVGTPLVLVDIDTLEVIGYLPGE